MSALTLVKRKPGWKACFCATPDCRTTGTKEVPGMRRSAAFDAYLCGYPAGGYCPSCVKEWKRVFGA